MVGRADKGSIITVPRFVILLRSVNTGKRKAPMAELREACREDGFADVQTYIQSGNLVLTTPLAAGALEQTIEKIVLDNFGFVSEAMVRTAAQWSAYAAGSPFPEVEAERPGNLHLCLSKRPPGADAAERLMQRAKLNERVVLAGDAVWIDFAGGAGHSEITPAFLDKVVGSTVTARNWNTVQRLQVMAEP
jgi:uncharacterized protein (DUF1697 family)